MTTNDHNPHRGEPEPLEDLFREVLDLVDDIADGITDDEIDDELRQVFAAAEPSAADGPPEMQCLPGIDLEVDLAALVGSLLSTPSELAPMAELDVIDGMQRLSELGKVDTASSWLAAATARIRAHEHNLARVRAEVFAQQQAADKKLALAEKKSAAAEKHLARAAAEKASSAQVKAAVHRFADETIDRAQRIVDDAREQAASIISEAKQRAAAIIDQAQERAARLDTARQQITPARYDFADRVARAPDGGLISWSVLDGAYRAIAQEIDGPPTEATSDIQGFTVMLISVGSVGSFLSSTYLTSPQAVHKERLYRLNAILHHLASYQRGESNTARVETIYLSSYLFADTSPDYLSAISQQHWQAGTRGDVQLEPLSGEPVLDHATHQKTITKGSLVLPPAPWEIDAGVVKAALAAADHTRKESFTIITDDQAEILVNCRWTDGVGSAETVTVIEENSQQRP